MYLTYSQLSPTNHGPYRMHIHGICVGIHDYIHTKIYIASGMYHNYSCDVCYTYSHACMTHGHHTRANASGFVQYFSRASRWPRGFYRDRERAKFRQLGKSKCRFETARRCERYVVRAYLALGTGLMCRQDSRCRGTCTGKQ